MLPNVQTMCTCFDVLLCNLILASQTPKAIYTEPKSNTHENDDTPNKGLIAGEARLVALGDDPGDEAGESFVREANRISFLPKSNTETTFLKKASPRK